MPYNDPFADGLQQGHQAPSIPFVNFWSGTVEDQDTTETSGLDFTDVTTGGPITGVFAFRFMVDGGFFAAGLFMCDGAAVVILHDTSDGSVVDTSADASVAILINGSTGELGLNNRTDGSLLAHIWRIC